MSSSLSTEKTICGDDLEGRRIVNIKYFFKTIQSIKHDGFDCSFRDLEFKKRD